MDSRVSMPALWPRRRQQVESIHHFSKHEFKFSHALIRMQSNSDDLIRRFYLDVIDLNIEIRNQQTLSCKYLNHND